ncbi:TonB-dependent receptor [Chitinophaga nivalis]|uniref:TonB-dependent receptor n=1 Tax=Chitinophaga nivalis TaxID=2991709 RepID=A0ABT3IH67_9BACT|nr:TonB-dependent receptor [Chitinophaga nivalis]MCW3467005.1 TonB-dependent receptor [Chitinophaga nivalis]MCW3483304.1 TonB-dependent receptor [Chitinophaga nivalis]
MGSRLLLLILLFPFFCTAQQIRGTILSKEGPLPAATIVIDGNGTQTDLSGAFDINVRKTGTVTLKINYIGFAARTVVVTVKPGLNQLGTILMEPANDVLGEVVVKGASAGSQIRAISIKKNASGIMEVLAADAIGKLPDRNAAEAVQRIQGVSIERDQGEGRYVSVRGTPIQWSATLLNGNRLPTASLDYTDRRIQMDIFPSELIEYVQLSKAITPDMEGDAIGGSINFITKAAPLSRTLRINAAGGYGDQARKGSYNASVVYGDRLMKGKLGFVLSAVIWDRTSAQDRYNMNYDFANPHPVQSYSITDLQLRDYIAHRKTTGLNAGLEYKFNDRHKIQFKGIYSEFVDAQMVRETYFYFNTKNASIIDRASNYHTSLYSGELSGQSVLSGKLTLDWAASMDKSRFQFKNPGYYPMATFQQAVTYEGLAADGKKYLAMDAPDGQGDVIDAVLPHISAATPISNEAMKLSQLVMVRSTNWEENKRFGFNVKYTPDHKLTVKAGGKFIHKNKVVQSPYDIYLGGVLGPAPTMASLGAEPFPYNGGFLSEIGSPYNNVIINQMPLGQLQNLVTPESIRNNKLLPYQIDSATNASGATKYFTGVENVYALYVMGEYKVSDKLTLTGGIRNEYNKVTFNGSKVTTNATGKQVTAITQDNSYNAFLPMLHVKYSVTDKDIVRLAYTRSFARPDFSSLNPGTTQDEMNKVISRGNANLKPTFANNFDVMAEHYFGGIGMVNVGAFYKKLTDLIYNNEWSENINGVRYAVSAPENLQSAWLAGFEAGVVKRFTGLPGYWKGFGVDVNYTFTDSKVKIPRFVNGQKTEDNSVIPKQAKHIFNASLIYEYGKVMARIAGNYKGKYLDVIRQAAGPDHYRWYAENFTVDFSASYAITPRIRAFLELNNITNAPVRYYHGTFNRVEQAEWYSFRGQLGVSAKIF